MAGCFRRAVLAAGIIAFVMLRAAWGGPDGDRSVKISGELKQWHKATVTIDGPLARELDSGGKLLPGSVSKIQGGSSVSTGRPPSDADKDWLAIIRR